MQVTITVNVSMRKIIQLPLSILLSFIASLAQHPVFIVPECSSVSVTDQPTNPTRPRTFMVLPISSTVNESEKTHINNSQFIN
jgi:hypothetical protein